MNWRNQGYDNDRNGRDWDERPRQRSYSQPNGYSNGGGKEQGEHSPNTGAARLNRKRRDDRDPIFIGVCNVEVNGEKHVRFVSIWINQDQRTGEDKIRLAFTVPNGPQQRQGGPRQNQNSYGQQNNQGGYRGQYQQEQPRREPNPNGAMSRARPIPTPQYRSEGPYDNAPPPSDYPDGPEQPFNDDISF